VVSQLDHRYAAQVEDIIISPTERDPYTTLRAELVRRLTPSREQQIRQLLMLKMGDHKPFQFLRQLRSLTPDASEDFLSTIWSSRLPPTIQAHLACQPECGLDSPVHCADLISKVAHQPVLASVTPTDNSAALQQEIEDLSRQVASPSAERDHLRASFTDRLLSSTDPYPSSRDPHTSTADSRPAPRNRRQNSRFPSQDDSTPTLCWYHRRFGARAQKMYTALHLPPAEETTAADITGDTCVPQ
jgi:hypothetical protein